MYLDETDFCKFNMKLRIEYDWFMSYDSIVNVSLFYTNLPYTKALAYYTTLEPEK